jgi:hypothetical protein
MQKEMKLDFDYDDLKNRVENLELDMGGGSERILLNQLQKEIGQLKKEMRALSAQMYQFQEKNKMSYSKERKQSLLSKKIAKAVSQWT